MQFSILFYALVKKTSYPVGTFFFFSLSLNFADDFHFLYIFLFVTLILTYLVTLFLATYI